MSLQELNAAIGPENPLKKLTDVYGYFADRITNIRRTLINERTADVYESRLTHVIFHTPEKTHSYGYLVTDTHVYDLQIEDQKASCTISQPRETLNDVVVYLFE